MRRFDGQRVVVWGLGRHGGGVAVTRYLARRGAIVTVVDRLPARDLSEAIDDLDETYTHIDFRPETELATVDPADFDQLVVNPAIPISHPDLSAWPIAKRTSELGLLAHELDGHQVVAVTGSNGKSTVCQWVVSLLKSLPHDRPVLLGANFELGLSQDHTANLLERVPLPQPSTVILELSSFQLAHLHDEPFAPDVAGITNITPNHLDWHPSFEHYQQSKQSLLKRARVGVTVGVPPSGGPSDVGSKLDVEQPTTSLTPPEGGAPTAILTAQIVRALGYAVSPEDLAATKPTIPHRQQRVATINGVTFIDDSAATTPESVTYLLDQYSDRNVYLIAGGRNKGFSIDAFARAIAPRVKAVATIGETASELAKYVAIHGGKVRSYRSLGKAVKWTRKLANSGDVIALSPGMASTDMFLDYRDRGHAFQQLLPDADD